MVPQALLALIACQNTPISLVSVVFVSVFSSEYSRQLGSNLQPCYHKPCLVGVQLFSCPFAVHIEDCDVWWFSGGCN